MQTGKIIWITAVMIILSQTAVAWNDYTLSTICDTVVKEVWGQELLDRCIHQRTMQTQQNFCQGLTENQAECMSLQSVIHPALIPKLMFSHSEIPQKQESCIIRNSREHKYLCETETKATDNADIWFDSSEKSRTECGRIYKFCIASAYIAESYNPFNWVKEEDPECNKNLAFKADEQYKKGGVWSVSQVCTFTYNHQLTGRTKEVQYRQQFGASSDTIASIIRNLTNTAIGLKAIPLFQPQTTITTIPPVISTVPKPVPTTLRNPVIAPTTTIREVRKEPVDEEGLDFSWITIIGILAVVLAIIYISYTMLSNKPGSKLDSRNRRHRIPHKSHSLGEMGKRESMIGKSDDSSLTHPGSKKDRKTVVIDGDDVFDISSQPEEEKPKHSTKKKSGKKSSISYKSEGSKLGDAGK